MTDEPAGSCPPRAGAGRNRVRAARVGVRCPPSVGGVFIVLPLVAMLARVQWSQFWALITSESSIAALWLSLKTSTASTVLCVLLGTPMALVLARATFPGLRLARSLVLLPLVLPPVVGGIALIYTFGRQGLLGSTWSSSGIRIAFTTTAVVIAQTFVALPFLVLSLEGSLRTAGRRYEAVAATLGARPDDGAAPGHHPAGAARPVLRRGPGVRPGPGRVRRHPDLRRQPAGRPPAPCRWRSTCNARPTPTPPSPCPWCWSWSRC